VAGIRKIGGGTRRDVWVGRMVWLLWLVRVASVLRLVHQLILSLFFVDTPQHFHTRGPKLLPFFGRDQLWSNCDLNTTKKCIVIDAFGNASPRPPATPLKTLDVRLWPARTGQQTNSIVR
jgi:hypothetical protein